MTNPHSINEPDSDELAAHKEDLRDLRKMRDAIKAQIEAAPTGTTQELETRLAMLERRCHEAEADVCRLRVPVLESRISIYAALLEMSRAELTRCQDKLRTFRAI